MSDTEIELNNRQTAWVRGATNTKMGHALLTTERLAFFETKFMGGVAGGALGAAIADRLQKRSEEGGPLLELPLADITKVTREKKLLSKDRIVLTTTKDEYRFSDGWKDWSGPLRDALAKHHGKTIADNGADAFSVS